MKSDIACSGDRLKDLHTAMTDAVQRYLDGYEVCVEGGYYPPDEEGQRLIEGAVWGLIEDPDFKRSFIERHAVRPVDPDASPGEQPHQDDLAVDRFAAAMKVKLAASRMKGRGGWSDPQQCAVETLAALLHADTRKTNAGAFEDIGAFAMMLHQRGADPAVLGRTAPPVVDIAGLRVAHQRLTELTLGTDCTPGFREVCREIAGILGQ